MTVQDWDGEAAAVYGEGWRCVRTMPLQVKVEVLTASGKTYLASVVRRHWSQSIYARPYEVTRPRVLVGPWQPWRRSVTGGRVAVAWRPASDPTQQALRDDIEDWT